LSGVLELAKLDQVPACESPGESTGGGRPAQTFIFPPALQHRQHLPMKLHGLRDVALCVMNICQVEQRRDDDRKIVWKLRKRKRRLCSLLRFRMFALHP
jgi:hypothetical protein